MARRDEAGCCALISKVRLHYMQWTRTAMYVTDGSLWPTPFLQSMGKSLTLRGTVDEARELLRERPLCKNSSCDAHLWRTRHQLDIAKIKLKALEDEIRKRGDDDSAAVERREAATLRQRSDRWAMQWGMFCEGEPHHA